MGFFEKMSEKITSTSKEVTQKAKDLAEIAKLNSSINSEQSKIKGFYYNIGERYYLEHKDCEDDEYQELISAIDACKETISKLEKQIEEIKKANEVTKQATQKICTNCGNVLQEDELFCPQCGTKYITNESETVMSHESTPYTAKIQDINLNKPDEVSNVVNSSAQTNIQNLNQNIQNQSSTSEQASDEQK